MQTAKEFLQSIARYKRRAAAIKRRIAEARDAAENVTAHFNAGGGASGKGGGKIEGAVLRIVQEEQRLGEVLERMHETRAEAVRLIDKLPNELHKEALELRYLDGKSWTRIAREMHYSKRRVYQLHSAALAELQQVFDSSEQHCT